MKIKEEQSLMKVCEPLITHLDFINKQDELKAVIALIAFARLNNANCLLDLYKFIGKETPNE